MYDSKGKSIDLLPDLRKTDYLLGTLFLCL